MIATIALGLTLLLHKADVFGPPPKPSRAVWANPGAGEGTPSPVSYAAEDGTVMRGWLFRAAHADRPYLLFFYGSNEDSQLERKRMAWLASAMDLNAVVFDYRGYGFSDGVLSPALVRQDAIRSFDAVRAMSRSAPIIVYGWSVGAEFAIHVAAHEPAAALILQAPPASAGEMAASSRAHDVPALVRWAVRLRHDEETAPIFQGAREIQAAAQPLLVLQGDADEVVPLAQGQEVFAASPSRMKRLVVVPGAHHNDLRITSGPAARALVDFVGAIGH